MPDLILSMTSRKYTINHYDDTRWDCDFTLTHSNVGGLLIDMEKLEQLFKENSVPCGSGSSYGRTLLPMNGSTVAYEKYERIMPMFKLLEWDNKDFSIDDYNTLKDFKDYCDAAALPCRKLVRLLRENGFGVVLGNRLPNVIKEAINRSSTPPPCTIFRYNPNLPTLSDDYPTPPRRPTSPGA